MSATTDQETSSTRPTHAKVTGSPSRTFQAGPDGPHLPADVDFARHMRAHHLGSLALAAVGGRRSADARVRKLAQHISVEQLPELTAIRSWLAAWSPQASSGTIPPEAATAGVSAATIQQLISLTGAPFDRRFLDLMIEAHRQAIALSRKELMNGASPAALTMAQAVIAALGQDIAEMQALLKH